MPRKRVKVFVTGPDAADSFTHNVAYTFREMGHDVRTDSGQAFSLQRSALRRGLDEILTRTSRSFRLRSEARTVRLAAEFRPDLTLMCTQTFEPDSVEAMRRVSGGKVVCWYGDSPTNLLRDHVVSGEYDAVFAKDPQFVETLHAMLGIEAHHLPEACNPAWHRPQADRSGDDVVVAGAVYGYRAAVVRRLLRAGEAVRVYGPAVSGWVDAEVRAAHTGRFLDHTSKARVFGEALACLSTFSPRERQGNANCRIFETCGCGALLLTERRAALEAFFEPGREYLTYADFEECLDHLERLRRDYGEAREIRRRAAARAHAEHTYRHRLQKMLGLLEI